MSSNLPFQPSGNVTIAMVNNTSVRQPLPTSINQDKQYRVFNSTNGVAYIKLGDSTVTASAADTPVPAGGFSPVMSMAGAETHVAAFLTSGATNGNAVVTRGEGS